MKKNLFNFAKAFLLGLAFVAVGCSDYDEDIKDLNNRIDEVISGKIDPLKMDLEKAVANLTAAQAALETEIKAAHAEDVATLKATDASLSEAISKANAAIVDLKAELNQALNDSIADVRVDFAEQIANASKQIAAVDEKVNAANALIEGLQSDVEDLNVKDAEFAKEIAGLKEQLADLSTELKDLISKVSKNTTDIANNAAGIAENKAAIKAINENLAKQVEVFTQFKATVDGKIAALEAQDAAFAEAIATINGTIETLQTTKLDKADFEAYKAEVAALFESVNSSLMSMNMAIVNLQAADKDLTKKISNLQKEMNEQFMNAFMQITTNAANIAAVKSDVTKNKKAIEANAKAIAQVNADLIAAVSALDTKDAELEALISANAAKIASLEQKVGEIEAEYDAFVAAYTAWKDQIDETILAIQQKDMEQDGALTLVNENLNAAIAKAEADLQAATATLQAAIDAANVNINKLANRVQSIVYIPEYSDGAATVHFAKLNKKVIEGASTIKYQVYPADCAEDIATLFNGGETSILKFDVQNVEPSSTRAAEAAALNITAVKALEDGVLEITFEARNFDENFYTGVVEKAYYRASLVLNYAGTEAAAAANLSSCYTELLPSKKTTATINVALYDAADAVIENGSHGEKLEIEYTRRNAPGVALEEFQDVKILEGSYVGYTIEGDATIYTWKEMAEMGYAITAPTYQYKVFATQDDAEASANIASLGYFSYKTLEGVEEALEPETAFEAVNKVQPIVSLTDKAIAETVGTHLCYTAMYDAMGVELSASQDVYIAPNKIEIAATVADIVWNYDADAEQDAFAGEKDYKRTGLALEISDELDESGNPIKLDGVKLTELVSTGWSGIQGLNGATAKLAVVDGDVVLNINKFKWNSTYDLVYTFKNHPSVEVVFTVTVKTIDRSREPVVITSTIDGVELAKNIAFAGKGDMKLNDIYTTLNAAYDLGSFAGKETEFLAEVLKNKAYTAATVVKSGDKAATDATKVALNVNKENATATVDFSYEAFDFVPMSVTYTKDITLWYGQPVQLVYTVNFIEPKAAYNFVANDLWVFEKNGAYASQVQGRYTDSNGSVDNKFTTDLAAFGVDNIDMDQAFYVAEAKDLTKPFDAAKLAELGLVTKFFIEKAPVEGVTMSGNIITYNGKVDSVDVEGQLYLRHDNGAEVKLTTSFDNDDKFINYVVLKFDPFTNLTATNDTVTVNVTEIRKYDIAGLSLFDIYESRLGDGEASEPIVDLFDENGDSFVGDGTNGWTAGATYDVIYNEAQITTNLSDVTAQIPDAYRNVIKWENNVLTFDNTYNMQLRKDVYITIDMTVNYKWDSKSAKTVVRFTNPELK